MASYRGGVLSSPGGNYDINILLSKDMVGGLVWGIYLCTGILRYKKATNVGNYTLTLTSMVNTTEVIIIDDKVSDVMNGYLIDSSDMYWEFLDPIKKDIVKLSFSTGEFIRGILTAFGAFNIDIDSLMIMPPYREPKNFERIYIKVTIDDKIYFNEERYKLKIPYIPRTKSQRTCTTKEIESMRGSKSGEIIFK